MNSPRMEGPFSEDHSGPLEASFVDVELDTPTKVRHEVNSARGLPPALVGKHEGAGNGRDISNESATDSRLPTVMSSETQRAAEEDEAAHVASARLVSQVSLVVSIVLAFLGFAIGFSENVLSVVGFGMEACLDGISSALVLWRFKQGKQREFVDSEAATQAKEARDARRERNSAVGIGATFVASAVLLMLSAAWKVLGWDPSTPEHKEEEHMGAVYTGLLAWPSSAIFFGLAVWKFRLGRALSSQVLRKDALCSALGSFLALICAVAAAVEQLAESSPEAVAGVDATAGATIALILGVEGLRTLKHNLWSWQSEHQELQ